MWDMSSTFEIFDFTGMLSGMRAAAETFCPSTYLRWKKIESWLSRWLP